MGTWGAGNFENDGALDMVGEILEGYVEDVEACLAELEEDPDEWLEVGEEKMMPLVELIYILAKQAETPPPDADRIGVWRNRYLELFDRMIDDYHPEPDFKVERRKVIADSFSRLMGYTSEFKES